MLRSLATLLCLSFVTASAAAQARLQAQLDSASVAWDVGDYPHALEQLGRLLTAPAGEQFLKPVALLTGELYRVTEVAPDGGTIRWSPTGTMAAYATGAGATRALHIVAIANRMPRSIATFPGFGLAWAPAGDRVAYLAVLETPELAAVRRALESALATREAQAIGRARQEVARVEGDATRIRLRDLRSSAERDVSGPAAPRSLVFVGDTLYAIGSAQGEAGHSVDLYAIDPAPRPRAVTTGIRITSDPVALPAGRIAYMAGPSQIVVRDFSSGATRTFEGASPAVSADGSALAFIGRDGEESTVSVVSLHDAGAPPAIVTRTARPVASPALAPDGKRVAFQMMPRDDWELYVAGSDGKGESRLTRHIQHDLLPRWLSRDRILAVMGEARHRRSYLYDPATGERTRLFHNNSIRTVAPEYEWAASPDGTMVLIVAERDGDTISPERGVYLADLARTVTREELLARIDSNATVEGELRRRGERMFAPVASAVGAAVEDVSVARIYEYEEALYRFDSKYITTPGNAMAIEYLTERLRAFGYEPELQWFEPRPGVRTANVIATLRGTVNPGLVYVVSSHFDSVEESPGADDNTSGTAALLEAARVLSGRPQPATIKLAFFTGEEAGLLGSREFVRRAVAAGDSIVGALNNDMVGWTGDHRLDNTIRYSNTGLRDLQHAAAFSFTNLVTYDAKYYKNTDAHAYYDAYGDIVAGIGSYPILGNPHYHRPHDVLETVNHQLVAEVSKTTVASIMLMASSPSRLTGLHVANGSGTLEARWTPSPERGVRSYTVAYGPPDDPMRRTATVTTPHAPLPGASPGTVVSVRARGDRGLEGWDWARVVVR